MVVATGLVYVLDNTAVFVLVLRPPPFTSTGLGSPGGAKWTAVGFSKIDF